MLNGQKGGGVVKPNPKHEQNQWGNSLRDQDGKYNSVIPGIGCGGKKETLQAKLIDCYSQVVSI